jgi:hypothetical protein
MTRPRVLLLALPLLAVCLSSAAGPQQPAGDGKKDPQSTYEPRSKPGAGQKFLEKFVGDWDVEKAFYPQSGEPHRVKGECKQTMIHGGRFLRSEFVFGQGEDQTTGTGLIGFEPDTGLFSSVWTDSRSTRMSLRQSQDRFNGEEIVLYSRTLQEGGRETRKSRTVTRLEDGGRKIVHRQYNPGKDDTERLVMELVMTRKTEAPRPGR